MVRVKKGGYIPRSGLLFIDYLNKIDLHGKVLDIGTGETGLLAHYAYEKGVDAVYACDEDIFTIEHAGCSSSVSSCINWLVSDVFDALPEDVRFDSIFSNPPQMPMENKGGLHDYGGPDGRDVILKILKNARNHLVLPNGKLFILCFDFLGITERFNSDNSILEITNQHGLNCRVVGSYKRTIRKGGKTEESIPWINKVYPKYKFKKDSDENLYHSIVIVEFSILDF